MNPIPIQIPKLTKLETEQYLKRLNLTFSKLERFSNPKEKLKVLHLNHLLNIPFDTTSIQLPKDWWINSSTTNQKFKIDPFCNGFEGVFLDQSFQNVVIEGRGGYCFNLNSLFARLLVSLGYEVNFLGARVNLNRNTNSKIKGYDWSPITHLILQINLPSTLEKIICDIGFGGGSINFPMDLIDSKPMKSLRKDEEFKLTFESCPNLFNEDLINSTTTSSSSSSKGYTLERWSDSLGYWSACYHFNLNPLTFSDLEVLNWYNSTSPLAYFKSFMVVSLLKPNGSRRSLTAMKMDGKQIESEFHHEEDQEQSIKVYTKESVMGEESEVVKIEPDLKSLYQTLLNEFGWGIKLDQR
ncbi:hypothetical protein DFH28DRAFT_890930 [Melampsora americana]|nr:hypothetical protein DFH28DRAFT_890930 [Melampsora americana]